MLTLRALMVAMGENRSKTDIELALIRKAESENTINSDVMHGPGHSFLNEKLYFMSGAEPSSLVRAYSEQRREKMLS